MNKKEREDFHDGLLVEAIEIGRNLQRSLAEANRKPPALEPLTRDPLATYDRLGRKQPTKITFMHVLRAIPSLHEWVGVVPSRAIAELVEDGDGAHAFIECPCGAKPIAKQEIEKCSGCERYYVVVVTIGSATKVLVAYGDMPIPGARASD